jgi:XTP/dITP diphosphohydrolase
MQLVFATHNANKVKEIQSLVPAHLQVQSLSDIGYLSPIKEPFDTLEKNSEIKALTIFNAMQVNCFSEDTGLLVEALAGAPGVYSARYAGENANNTDNINLLLHNLKNIENRKACFKTIITFKSATIQIQFAGECHGKILNAPIGTDGFGYDAIFVPDGSNLSFAQMPLEEKNKFSHRKKAMQLFLEWLQTQ